MKRKMLIGTLILSILASALLLILSGCGGGNGKIQITVGMWPEATETSDIAMFKEWKTAFEHDYPQYEIVAEPYTYHPDTFVSKVASGKLPVVFQTYFTEPQKMIENRYIRDITSELEELGWAEHMDEYMKASVSKDGRIYGIPRDGYGMGLFLNLKMLNELDEIPKVGGEYQLRATDGTPNYPTTFDDIYRICQKAQQVYSTDTYGLVVLSADKNGGWQFTNFAWNFGVEAFQVKQADGTYKANLNHPRAVKAMEWIRTLRQENLIASDTSVSYSQWYARIGEERAVMAFAGSDAIALPVTKYNNISMNDIAFVPMPTGDGITYTSLFGGTPYVFSNRATDEQVKGALLFLKYMGRSPETDEISIKGLEDGYKTARSKGMPIIPTIRPWVNADYLEKTTQLDAEYINVNMKYFEDFFETIFDRRRAEEPYYCQEMYDYLDKVIQEVLARPDTANSTNLLTTYNSQFQNNQLSKVK